MKNWLKKEFAGFDCLQTSKLNKLGKQNKLYQLLKQYAYQIDLVHIRSNHFYIFLL